MMATSYATPLPSGRGGNAAGVDGEGLPRGTHPYRHRYAVTPSPQREGK
jgi:hypothetical protein